MPRWFPRFFLCIFFYSTSIWVVGRMADGVSYLLVEGHSLVLWQFFNAHPFERAFVVGLLAGIVPLQAWLAASGLFDRKITVLLKRLNPDRLKPWICVIFSPLIVFALLAWTIGWLEVNSRHSSVLQTASPYPVAGLFDGFLSSNCANLIDWRAELWGDRYAFLCMMHIQLISAWVLTLGYSFAPIVRKRLLPLLSVDHPLSADDLPAKDVQESTMTGKTDT